MKKYIIATAVTILCASVCIAATYTIKTNGGVTTVRPASPSTTKTQTTNYNTYSSGQYVSNNTVNSSYAGIIDIVMDFSGSMSDVVNVAKATMSSVVSQIPPSTQVGFRVFGQGDFVEQPKMGKVKTVEKTTNSEGKTVYKLNIGKHQSSGFFGGGSGCRATHLVTPIASANANALIAGMNSVELGGSTPMVYALEEAVNSDLSKYSRNIPKKIVLITDGGENCGGDACAFAKTLMATRRDIQVDVVLVSSNSSKLRCLAQTTGGKVYNLSDVRDLPKVLSTSINTPVNENQTPINTEENQQQQQYEFWEE